MTRHPLVKGSPVDPCDQIYRDFGPIWQLHLLLRAQYLTASDFWISQSACRLYAAASGNWHDSGTVKYFGYGTTPLLCLQFVVPVVDAASQLEDRLACQKHGACHVTPAYGSMR